MKLRTIIFFLIFTYITLFCGGFAQEKENELKPRGFAGFTYRPVSEKDIKGLNLPDAGGIFVLNVFPKTPAAKAGLLPGDIIKKYDDHIISDASEFLNISRLYYADDKIKVSVLRAGSPLTVTLILCSFPREKNNEIDIEYTYFAAGNIKLRAVVTSPWGSYGKKLPAILMVSALGSPRLIDMPSYNMQQAMAHKIAKMGFRKVGGNPRYFNAEMKADKVYTEKSNEFNTRVDRKFTKACRNLTYKNI